MYKQEIFEIVSEWYELMKYTGCAMERMPITLVDFIKLRSQNGTIQFIKNEDWEIIKNQRTKLSAVDAKLASIEEDFKKD